MSFEFFIGGRYLRAKKKQTFISLITFLSVAGVTVGVMALIVVIAVMSGFESDLKARILGVDSHVLLQNREGPFPNYAAVIDAVREVRGVRSAAPYIDTQVMLRSSSGASGAKLRGLDQASQDSLLKDLGQSAQPGQPAQKTSGLDGNSTPGIVLGKELARNLGVVEEDSIYLISPRGAISPIGHVPAMRRFQVSGLFESGLYEYDGALAYVDLSEAQKIMRMGDKVNGVAIRVADIYRADAVGADIIKRLGAPFWTRDWMQMNQNLFAALKLEKAVMFVILALIVLVAAFNIASTLIMMVMGKTRDIAILKAMGAADRSIRKIFVLNGMIIGAIGTFLGVCLGLILCLLLQHYKFIELPGDVYYITTLPVRLEVWDVFFIAAAALGICFLATLYPARQASQLKPVEAIRYG